ncbi:MAG: DUF87 domain-containing protein [Solirubrobacteraceae bacterium]
MDIRHDMLVLRRGSLRQVLECQPVPIALKDEDEQAGLLHSWTELLHALTHPIQVSVHIRPAEDRDLLSVKPNGVSPVLSGVATSYAALLADLCTQARLVQRDFYVVVPWDPPTLSPRKPGTSDAPFLRLEERTRTLTQSLNRAGVEARPLQDDELLRLLYHTINPVLGRRQPLLPQDLTLNGLQDLLAPAAFVTSRDSFEAGDRKTRTLALIGYPRYLHLGWLDVFLSLRSALRVSLFISPVPTELALPFLEKKIAELASTLRFTAERSGKVDVERKAALADAQALQDRLVRAEERFFDLAVYATLEAADAQSLEDDSTRLETALGGLMLKSRRLLFQMEQGYWSTLPLGVDRVGIRRNMTTPGLRVTFPFSASNYGQPLGQLYGVDPASGSPVFLDRFALPNANAVVLAQSGGGKSYAVKVEILRALLRAIDVCVLDPEGEYVALARAVHGHVESISPTSSQLPSAFALGSRITSGACTERKLTVLALVRQLLGGLAEVETLLLQEALGRIYAFKGISDEPDSYGSEPPDSTDLLQTLEYQSRQGPDSDTARLLERRLRSLLEGPSGWLLQGRSAVSLQPSGLNVIALANLPEETRNAAMFLVLDRLWEHLRQRPERRKTFLVIDEAWWLVRQPDTARFVYRLAKTARKLNVGLTLITQDVLDLLSSDAGKTVIANSSVQLLFRQSARSIPELAECFGLTKAEGLFLISAPVGEGILMGRNSRTRIQVLASAAEDTVAKS